MKARIKFTKIGNVKYIGHLDLLRLFQRCIRRAHLPVEYSKGYNPHQLLSIALPLPLGATSEGEYLDIELNDESKIQEIQIQDKLNEFLPEGISVEEVCILSKNIKIGMAAVDAAKYQIFVDKNTIDNSFLQSAKEFFAANEIWIEKTNKKGTSEINVKNMIYQYSIDERENQWIVDLFLAAGSRSNLKPELIMKQFYEDNGWEFKDYKIVIHRVDIFSKVDDKFIPLSQLIKWSE